MKVWKQLNVGFLYTMSCLVVSRASHDLFALLFNLAWIAALQGEKNCYLVLFFCPLSVDDMISEVDLDGDGRIDFDGEREVTEKHFLLTNGRASYYTVRHGPIPSGLTFLCIIACFGINTYVYHIDFYACTYIFALYNTIIVVTKMF